MGLSCWRIGLLHHTCHRPTARQRLERFVLAVFYPLTASVAHGPLACHTDTKHAFAGHLVSLHRLSPRDRRLSWRCLWRVNGSGGNDEAAQTDVDLSSARGHGDVSETHVAGGQTGQTAL